MKIKSTLWILRFSCKHTIKGFDSIVHFYGVTCLTYLLSSYCLPGYVLGIEQLMSQAYSWPCPLLYLSVTEPGRRQSKWDRGRTENIWAASAPSWGMGVSGTLLMYMEDTRMMHQDPRQCLDPCCGLFSKSGQWRIPLVGIIQGLKIWNTGSGHYEKANEGVWLGDIIGITSSLDGLSSVQ